MSNSGYMNSPKGVELENQFYFPDHEIFNIEPLFILQQLHALKIGQACIKITIWEQIPLHNLNWINLSVNR